MTWNTLKLEYPKRKRKNWNISYQFNIRNRQNTTEVGYVLYEAYKAVEDFFFLRTSPICFLLFINKILILIFCFYWKHFMPPIPSKGIFLVAQKVKNLLVNAGHIGSIPD